MSIVLLAFPENILYNKINILKIFYVREDVHTMKRRISFILAMALCVTMAGCGGNQTTDISETCTTVTSATTEDKAAAESEPADFFGGEYDPLSDDYDPYGGGGASADKQKAETASADKAEETVSAENDAPAETQAAETTSAPKGDTKPAQTTAAAKSDKGEKSNSDVKLELNVSNGWESGSDKFIQVDGTITNNGSKIVSGWTAVISADKSAAIEQSWNCDLNISSGKITVTPVDYNKEISTGGNVTFGLILKNAGSFDASKATLTCGTTTVSGQGGGNNSGNNNNNNNSGGSSVGNNNPEIFAAKDVPEPTTDDWLYVKGNKIVDKNGKEVWLTGVNWFGYNTGTNTFDGLWSCDLNSSIASIANRGFNLLRIPISTELIKQWSNGEYPNANFNQATNSYLVGMNSLEIFDYVIGQCRANGIKIMIDIHCAKTDSMGHMKNMWYEGNITEKDYLDALKWIAKRYKNDDTIIAYDLENEPHGKANESPRAKWDDSNDADNWKYIAEKAANAVFEGNPEALVMVEGIEIYPIDTKKNGNFSSTNMGDYYCTWWGGNLRGVKDNPVDLGKKQNKLVYSPHDYGPAVYQQPWFKGNYTYDSLYNDCWHDNWFYIQEQNIAPLLIGEWGGFMTEPNLTWMTYMRKFIKENKINHTFWCFNSNSGDTGGLVKDDFKTWDEEKYAFVKEVLWQQNGKFVGLDHKIPLGNNGITLSEAK